MRAHDFDEKIFGARITALPIHPDNDKDAAVLTPGKAGLRPPMRWRARAPAARPPLRGWGLALRCARRLLSCVGRGGRMGVEAEQKDRTLVAVTCGSYD